MDKKCTYCTFEDDGANLPIDYSFLIDEDVDIPIPMRKISEYSGIKASLRVNAQVCIDKSPDEPYTLTANIANAQQEEITRKIKINYCPMCGRKLNEN